MKRAFAFVLLTLSTIALAQTPQIKSGATVYFEPANVGTKGQNTQTMVEVGFETYLSAAIMKKGVPLVVVIDKDKAEYIIRSNAQQVLQHTGSSSWIEISASFSVIDQRTSQVVFAGSTSRNDPRYRSTSRNSLKGAAEDCAEQLAKFIKKHK